MVWATRRSSRSRPERTARQSRRWMSRVTLCHESRGHDWAHDTEKGSPMPFRREMFTRLARYRSPDPAMTRSVTLARRFWLPLILAVAVAAMILLLIWPAWAYQWSWTGFGPSTGVPKFQRISIA